MREVLRGIGLKLLKTRAAAKIVALAGVLKAVLGRLAIDPHAADGIYGASAKRRGGIIGVVVVGVVLQGHGSSAPPPRGSWYPDPRRALTWRHVGTPVAAAV